MMAAIFSASLATSLNVTRLNSQSPERFMTRSLLIRGMVVGILAGLLVFFSARWLGEPQVDRAIAFETAADQAKGEAPDPEVFSRHIQKTVGLLTGTVIFGAALGGIFGIVFALAYGRVGPSRPRALAAFLASIGFVAIAFVPSLKYPANPPSIGNPETIGIRTGAFFLMILISIMAMVLSVKLSRYTMRRFGGWNGGLLAAASFVLVVSVLAYFLPAINEVPSGFPADLLWRFRLVAWVLQVVLWASIGLLFGWLTERDAQWSRTIA
jgi:predicted cobalt transporter CbtA